MFTYVNSSVNYLIHGYDNWLEDSHHIYENRNYGIQRRDLTQLVGVASEDVLYTRLNWHN